MNVDFSKKLLDWNKTDNLRTMPWKGEKDPYKIWLSEIILQQTRVEQGWTYYENFIKAFPTVHHLAKAPRKKVFKLWEGLGYYNRCKNLIETAKKISKNYKGKFPRDYQEIKSFKGIGPYTAAAIASFAFNLPFAVVDGNVERVLSRYFGMSTPTDTADGKRMFAELAGALLDKKQPGIFNQAMMDFGAVICKPKNPLCAQCPQQKDCEAYIHQLLDVLPVKSKRIEKKKRWFYYFIIECKGSVYIHMRKQKDIWQHLYEFVLYESDHALSPREMLNHPFAHNILGKSTIKGKNISLVYKQQLTHQTIYAQFIHVTVPRPLLTLKDFTLVKKKDIMQLPFPKSTATYIKQPLWTRK
ncbi:MAG TPA: A/G-specific adenine glycosylase [Puia sp.]|jgi:A/G-specific adenine glycosylase|nr:A/G-specific adenine glycosylase [Puia sp.]